MRRELVDKLKAAYPALFAPWSAGGQCDQGVDVWCGDGWFELLHTLCHYLHTKLENGAPQMRFQEVKQKYGKLNIAALGGNESTRALVLSAESASLFVCEACGKSGRLVDASGSIKVACANCCPAGAAPVGPDAVLTSMRARWARLSHHELDGGHDLVLESVFCPGERTVVADRYGGGYSGGKFIAWPLPAAAIPPRSQGGDIDAGLFWSSPQLCGRGDTPETALADLEKLLAGRGLS